MVIYGVIQLYIAFRSGKCTVIAVVDIFAKIASLCFQDSVAVKDARADVERPVVE